MNVYADLNGLAEFVWEDVFGTRSFVDFEMPAAIAIFAVFDTEDFAGSAGGVWSVGAFELNDADFLFFVRKFGDAESDVEFVFVLVVPEGVLSVDALSEFTAWVSVGTGEGAGGMGSEDHFVVADEEVVLVRFGGGVVF